MVQHHLWKTIVKAILSDFTENTYIINEKKECFIIDPGTNFSEIVSYINEKQLNVKGILLTHGHFDHIFSLNEIVSEYDVPVHIHEKERDFLFDPNLNLSSMTYKRFVLTNKEIVNTISGKDTFKLGYETIKVVETPGHTRGGVCYHYKNFLFSGDTLFKGSIGRHDLPTSNKAEITRSVNMLVSKFRANTIVYPGHGHFTTILNEKLDNPYVKR